MYLAPVKHQESEDQHAPMAGSDTAGIFCLDHESVAGTERSRCCHESETCLGIPSHTETIGVMWVVEMTKLDQMKDITPGTSAKSQLGQHSWVPLCFSRQLVLAGSGASS